MIANKSNYFKVEAQLVALDRIDKADFMTAWMWVFVSEQSVPLYSD